LEDGGERKKKVKVEGGRGMLEVGGERLRLRLSLRSSRRNSLLNLSLQLIGLR
jgi:hypothetical protein